MDRPELALLKKIRLQPGKKINTLFMGEYHSAFRGQGLSFDSVREYRYGDDVRSIDWNVSARMRNLFVKQYVEERELSVVLMIDMSGSTEFGGGGRRKRDLILETSALFLNLVRMHNDRVSVCLFTDRVERYLRPRKGRKFVLKVLDEILKCDPGSRRTDLSVAIDFIRRVLKKRSVIFVISDFLDAGSFSLKMKLLARRHDVIPVQVSDPMEKEARFFGLTEFLDLETGKSFLSDALPGKGNFPVLAEFNGIALSTDRPIEVPILRFFEKRNRTRLTRS